MFKKGHKGHKAAPKKVAPKKETKKVTPKNIQHVEETQEDEMSYEHVDEEVESVFTKQTSEVTVEPEHEVDYGNLEDMLKEHTFAQTDVNPNITEVDEQTMQQLKDLRLFESKEKEAVKSGGKLNYYPPVSAAVQKETQENIKSQVINILMSQKGFSFMEAKAEVEVRLKNNTLDEIRDLAIKGGITKDTTSNQPTGIQIQTMKSNIKYY